MVRIVLDTDAGVDDAIALIAALGDPKCTLVAITTCHGNVPVDQVTINVLRVLQTLNHSDIPVHEGCPSPLVGSRLDYTWPGHGVDGLGDANSVEVPIADAKMLAKSRSEHAVTALIRLSKEPEPPVFVFVGPLTNLALAIRLDPMLPSRLKRVVIMGGSTHAVGNVSLAAEFNFHSDPEAAHIVLHSFSHDVLELVTWDFCLDHSLDWDFFDELVSHGSLKSKLLTAICGPYQRICRGAVASAAASAAEAGTASSHKTKSTLTNFVPCDAYAILVVLHPNLVSKETPMYVTVELSGKATRGMLVLDWYEQSGQSKNVRILNTLGHDFRDALYRAFA